MMDLYRGALRRPERSIQRLYGLAQRDIWREDDHPWGELSFDDLPDPIREGAAGLLTQVQSTELAPLLCAARMVERMPRLDAELFCAIQVHDEARHVQWSSRKLEPYTALCISEARIHRHGAAEAASGSQRRDARDRWAQRGPS